MTSPIINSMETPLFSDTWFMNEAFKEALKAFEKDEVPVGAVIVCDNTIIARAHNLTETLNDVTAHAEMQAFTSATGYLRGKYLQECRMYVTLEPCVMCAGAAFWTRPGKIIWGADDEKRGFTLNRGSILHPKTLVEKGVMGKECGELLTEFFRKKRKHKQ